jgi:hypothetical protein
LDCGEVIEFNTSLVVQIEKLGERLAVQVTRAHRYVSGFCTHCQTGARQNRDRIKEQEL